VYTRHCGPSLIMSLKIPHFTWYMERTPCYHLKYMWSQHGSHSSMKLTRTKQKSLIQTSWKKWNKALVNMKKYQESLKHHYNKSVVPQQLEIGDLVLKKDIRTKDKHKLSSPREEPFIVLDIAAPWLMF
jgi:hypothetical protein